jgi:hypothetical protein
LNCIQLKNLIPNQFNSERWSHEKNINLKNFLKEKKIAIKEHESNLIEKKSMEDEIIKTKHLKNDLKQNK